MARIIYAPGCYASVVTGATGSAPQKLPRILHAETNLTTAPALGQAQLVIADPDGTWAGTLKPNDLLTVTFTSRSRQAAALTSVAALGTDASLVAGPSNASWSGLIDMAGPTLDPRAQYGRACAIMASSWWKLLLITTALTKPLQNGIFIAPLTAITDVVNMALADVLANTGLSVPVTFGPEVLGVTTGTAPIPQDMSDPQFQSWASLLMAAVVPAGFETFFDESGTLHIRAPQFMQNAADATVPNEELFSAQGGVSDNNLVTNVAVGWSPKPAIGLITMAPAGGLSSIGPLPSQLQGLPRLGKRFVALPAGWILSAQQAGQYASFVRAVGMANTDQIEAAVVLNGDLRVGTILDMPGINRRYYAATISHVYDFGGDAETRVSGRYGIPRDQSWDPALLNSGYNNILGGPSDTTDGTGQTTAVTLPPLAADPDVRWQPPDAPALSVDDIDRILRTHTPPSPLVGQAQLIWSQAHQYGVLPAFALAVWQIETQLGTDGSTGAQQFNPGNVGPGLGYLDWASAIGAWFALIAGPTYIGGGLHTVGTIGPVYAPTAQNPHWIGDVTKQLLYYRGQARIPSVPTPVVTPPPVPGDGSAPSGYPFAPGVLYPVTQTFGNASPLEPPGTYEGVHYAHFHRGIDLGCGSGTALYATMPGTIKAGGAGILPDVYDSATGYGFCVYLLNGPYIVKYAHCSALAPGVAPGQQAQRGQVIALSGATGNVTGPHLHYEVDFGTLDHFVNPVTYLG